MSKQLNKRRGKELERFVAKFFAGKRLAILGGEDVTFGNFSVECKSTASRMKTLRKWMSQANSNSGGKTPILYIHEQGTPHVIDYVALFAEDFKKLVQAKEEQ